MSSTEIRFQTLQDRITIAENTIQLLERTNRGIGVDSVKRDLFSRKGLKTKL